MPLLSDFCQSLEDIIEQLHSTGLPEWIFESPRQCCDEIFIEEYRQLIPWLSLLCMQLPQANHLTLGGMNSSDDFLWIKIAISPVSGLDYKTLSSQEKWTHPSFSLSHDKDSLRLKIKLKRELEPKPNYPNLISELGFTQEEGKRFLHQCRKELEHKASLLPRLFLDKNWQELHRLSHAIKGTALNLGLERLRIRALLVEKASKNEQLSEEILRELLQEADRVLKDFL